MIKSLASLSVSQLKRAAAIKGSIEKLEKQLAGLLGADAPAKAPAARRKRSRMSAAARAAIASAQRARWAKWHKARAK
jgi:hypothetical protein